MIILKKCTYCWVVEDFMGDEVVVGHFESVAKEPVVLVLDDDGHAFLGVVDFGHEGVGLGGDDGVGADWLLGYWIKPVVIEAGVCV